MIFTLVWLLLGLIASMLWRLVWPNLTWGLFISGVLVAPLTWGLVSVIIYENIVSYGNWRGEL